MNKIGLAAGTNVPSPWTIEKDQFKQNTATMRASLL